MIEFTATGRTIGSEISRHRFLIENNTIYLVTFKKWYKRRSTGPFSQNHAINGYCQQIAEYTGHDFDYIKVYCKRKAIGRGYPFKRGLPAETRIISDDENRSEAVPYSETEIDTVQAGYLIDTIKEVADFLGVRLREI